MTTINTPDVPIPAGFNADEWQNGVQLSHRVLLGETRRITGRRHFDTVRVQPTAVQFADGTIDDGGVFEPPQVYVGDQSLPAPQAREVIAALIWATETIERWAAE
jgi:hypothetical protein